jgi:phage/plasmid-like protein (TIGR03299 family)
MTAAATVETPQVEDKPEATSDQAAEARVASGLSRPVGARLYPWADVSTGRAEEGEVLTSQQLLDRANLDWDVATRPLYSRRELLDGTFEFIQHPKAREVYRTDTQEPIGVVKSHYQAYPNREAFAFGDQLLEEGGRWIEAGLQGNGFRVFMCLRVGAGFKVLGSDSYDLFLFLSTGHDGGRSVTASAVPFRDECLNHNDVMGENAKTTLTAQHTNNLATRLAEAREALKLARSYERDFTRQAEKLAKVRVTEEKARALVNQAIPQRRSRREEVVVDVIAVYRTSPQVEEFRGTGYGLVNAMTEYMDHVKRQRSGNARFEAIMWGEAAKARRTLAAELVKLS